MAIFLERVRAGDTLSWRVAIPGYTPADGWSLVVRLINGGHLLDVVGTADGDGWRLDVPAAQTSTWSPGVYVWHAVLTRGFERVTVGDGQTEILPDLAGMTAGYDARSAARKALDAARQAMAAWIASGGQVQEVEINGRRVRYRSLAEIRQAIALLELEVAREEAAARVAAGLDTGRRVLVRF